MIPALINPMQGSGATAAPAPPASVTTFIGRSQGAESGNSYTYTAAPIATNSSDIIVVGVATQAVLNSPVTAITVGGVSMTQWSVGNVGSIGSVRSIITFFYGVPGVFATANVVLTTTGIGNPNATLMVWKLSGLNSTPVAVKSSVSATSSSVVIGAISDSLAGSVIAFAVSDAHQTMTESWSGSETVVKDTNALDVGSNTGIAGFHITPASNSSGSFTVNLGASATHCGGAISFGP